MDFYFVHNGVHQSELVIHTYFHKKESGVAATYTSLDKCSVCTETYKSLY
jgi:hypothetical protein